MSIISTRFHSWEMLISNKYGFNTHNFSLEYPPPKKKNAEEIKSRDTLRIVDPHQKS